MRLEDEQKNNQGYAVDNVKKHADERPKGP